MDRFWTRTYAAILAIGATFSVLQGIDALALRSAPSRAPLVASAPAGRVATNLPPSRAVPGCAPTRAAERLARAACL
jgi:hypothetical protein